MELDIRENGTYENLHKYLKVPFEISFPDPATGQLPADAEKEGANLNQIGYFVECMIFYQIKVSDIASIVSAYLSLHEIGLVCLRSLGYPASSRLYFLLISIAHYDECEPQQLDAYGINRIPRRQTMAVLKTLASFDDLFTGDDDPLLCITERDWDKISTQSMHAGLSPNGKRLLDEEYGCVRHFTQKVATNSLIRMRDVVMSLIPNLLTFHREFDIRDLRLPFIRLICRSNALRYNETILQRIGHDIYWLGDKHAFNYWLEYCRSILPSPNFINFTKEFWDDVTDHDHRTVSLKRYKMRYRLMRSLVNKIPKTLEFYVTLGYIHTVPVFGGWPRDMDSPGFSLTATEYDEEDKEYDCLDSDFDEERDLKELSVSIQPEWNPDWNTHDDDRDFDSLTFSPTSPAADPVETAFDPDNGE